MVKHKLKNIAPRTADVKYTGPEPEWTAPVADDDRRVELMRSLQWYNYHCDKKTAKQCVMDWLHQHRPEQHRAFAGVPDSAVTYQLAWLCRMNLRGWQLDEREQTFIDATILEHTEANRRVRQVTAAEPVEERVTIQDRLRARADEIAGELEGMYDDVIKADCRATADHKPMAVIRGMNLAPQMLPVIRDAWQTRLEELHTAHAGRDPDLVTAYGIFTKIQLRNLVKFAEQVLADCASYVQIKRVERKPKKRKPVSAEHLARKFRILPRFDELDLISEPAARLVGVSEAWLYDTKKRKMIYATADSHIGTLTIKNNSIVGLDENLTVMKTLRQPAEQIKSLRTASVPNARKFFRDIRATEIKWNGRGNENLIVLRVK